MRIIISATLFRLRLLGAVVWYRIPRAIKMLHTSPEVYSPPLSKLRIWIICTVQRTTFADKCSEVLEISDFVWKRLLGGSKCSRLWKNPVSSLQPIHCCSSKRKSGWPKASGRLERISRGSETGDRQFLLECTTNVFQADIENLFLGCQRRYDNLYFELPPCVNVQDANAICW